MVGAMRALTRTSMHLSDDCYVRLPDVLHFCDSDSLVRSLEGRLRNTKAARNSATRVWWPEIARALKWWRMGGAKWNMKWRRGHVERRHPNHEDWTPADWGNVIADTLAGQGWATESALRHTEPGAPQGVTITSYLEHFFPI